MKKTIIVIAMLGITSIPLLSFKTSSAPTAKSGIIKFTNTYVGINDPASVGGKYYEIYTDGTDNVVQVYDYINSVTYVATGYVYTPVSHGFPFPTEHVNFTVYSQGVAIDSYDGVLAQ